MWPKNAPRFEPDPDDVPHLDRLIRTSRVVFLFSLLALISLASIAQAGKKRTPRVGDGSAVDLIVMQRDAVTGAVHVLGVSNRGFIGTRVSTEASGSAVHVALPDEAYRTVRVESTADGSRDRVTHVGPRSPAVAAVAPTPATAPTLGPPPPDILGNLDLWLVTRRHDLAAVVRLSDQRAWRNPSCSGCVVRVHEGLLVMTRGLAPERVDGLVDTLRVSQKTVPRKLMGVARDIRKHWPAGARVRSVFFQVSGDAALPAERLTVDHDAAGRAHEHLPRLHAWHLGDVAVPGLVASALRARERGDEARALGGLAKARVAIRAAIDTDDGIALWHARLGLVLALENVANDTALREVRRAVSMAPRGVDVRLLAAETHRLRGELGKARLELAAVLRLRPEHAIALGMLAELSSRSG